MVKFTPKGLQPLKRRHNSSQLLVHINRHICPGLKTYLIDRFFLENVAAYISLKLRDKLTSDTGRNFKEAVSCSL